MKNRDRFIRYYHSSYEFKGMSKLIGYLSRNFSRILDIFFKKMSVICPLLIVSYLEINKLRNGGIYLP